MPAELAERLIGECLCGADGWRDSLRCAKVVEEVVIEEEKYGVPLYL